MTYALARFTQLNNTVFFFLGNLEWITGNASWMHAGSYSRGVWNIVMSEMFSCGCLKNARVVRISLYYNDEEIVYVETKVNIYLHICKECQFTILKVISSKNTNVTPSPRTRARSYDPDSILTTTRPREERHVERRQKRGHARLYCKGRDEVEY